MKIFGTRAFQFVAALYCVVIFCFNFYLILFSALVLRLNRYLSTQRKYITEKDKCSIWSYSTFTVQLVSWLRSIVWFYRCLFSSMNFCYSFTSIHYFFLNQFFYVIISVSSVDIKLFIFVKRERLYSTVLCWIEKEFR